MADVLFNPYPARFVDPNEPGLVAAYTFADNELAQFGRYLNRASTGAAYDLTTRVGTPLVGQGGGIYAEVLGGSWTRPAIQVGNSNFSYSCITENALAAAVNFFFQSTAHYIGMNAGVPRVSFDLGGTWSTAGFATTGRGPYQLDALYDGTNQILCINGVQVDSDAVVALAPVNTLALGSCNCTKMAKVYNVRRTVAQARASYIRDFASKVLWQWTPRDVGEGPAGGILTGSASGVGGWTCPLGAATMGFVWRPDLSAPGGGRLALTDTQTVNLNRIDFEFGTRPWFGSFLVEYEVRDPATDSMVVGFTPRRGVDPTAAASGSYWLHVRQVAGPWWRSSVYLANGAQIDAADTPTLPVVGDRGKVLFTRDVDGTIQVWSYLQSTNGWWWSAATGNDVTVLPEGCITIAPRGAYVERVTWFQGAATPHELGIRVP